MTARQLGRIAALALLLGGCFAQVKDLPPVDKGATFAPIPERDPDLLVGLAISGGGSRAATFAAGVLEALAQVRVKDSGGERSVLERVQYISSVSGGSLATGYFAARKPSRSDPVLTGQGLSPAWDQFFKDYKSAMQEDFELAAAWRQVLLFRAFNPTKLAYSLAEVWDRRFFHGMTFGDLYERERSGDSPRIILNGTSYNSGQRFALTTLAPADFEYDFVNQLLGDLMQRSGRVTPEGRAIIQRNLAGASKQFSPLTFESIGADHRRLPLSLGVVSSASFPPVVGPITYGVSGGPPYQHIGDGGLFDNLGTESLTTLFLKKIPRDSKKRGLIIVIDAAFPFNANAALLQTNKRGFQIFKRDPARIVGIMEERANAYQLMLWDALRTEGVALPDFASLRVEVLRHTEADWDADRDLPRECRGDFPAGESAKAIKEAITQVPTLFRISKCHGALMIDAAHQAVAQHRKRIVEFLESPN
ncbi:MAG TPA: patatin-like phospholipase family protein [Methylomirabilota bacterium]|nr:patatin-like phospholipase family protein [Methylomirabilota bacterium]